MDGVDPPKTSDGKSSSPAASAKSPSEVTADSSSGGESSNQASLSSGTSCDVVVIGAGVSGLTAAHQLLKLSPSLNVRILEAKDRVGGRTLSVPMRVRDGAEETFDMGGQWVGTPQTDIMELLDELGLQTYPQYTKGTKFMQLGGTKIRRYKSTIPNLGSLRGLIQLQRFIWRVDRLARQCAPLSTRRERTVRRLDCYTLDAYARKHMSNTAAVESVDSACKVIFGCDAKQIGLVHFLLDVAAAGSLRPLLEATPGSAQEFRVKGGTQQISEKLADLVGRHRISLNEPVNRIQQRGDCVEVHSQRMYTCRYVISSMPPNQLQKVQLLPPLSPSRQTLIDNMPMGSLIKFVVTYQQAFWREAGCSGEIVSNGGPALVEECTCGPLCIVYDATTDTGSPALVGFIAGSNATQWRQCSDDPRTVTLVLYTPQTDTREKAVTDSLASFFGQKAKNYIEYREKVWAEEEYSGGCPLCFTVPGLMEHHWLLRQSHGRVVFCGTELATSWMGFLSGAVQTGRRAAAEVLSQLESENRAEQAPAH